MKRFGLRVLVGLMAFGIGISVVWTLNPLEVCFTSQKNQKTKIANPDENIEVHFVGYGKDKKRPTLIFEVTNKNDYPVRYLNYREGQLSASVKINGMEPKKIGTGCGFGIIEFKLGAGETLTSEFPADLEILEFLDQQGSFEFGFYFKFNEKEGKKFWSQPITISEEMKKNIIKNAPKYLKQ